MEPLKKRNVWIVDDDRSIRWVLDTACTREGYQTKTFESAEGLLLGLDSDCPDVLMTDIRMSGMDGLTLLEHVKERFPRLPMIVMTAFSDFESVTASYKGGAFEFLAKPFDLKNVFQLLEKATQRQTIEREKKSHQSALKEEKTVLLGKSAAMKQVFSWIEYVRDKNAPLLLEGEPGVGKRTLARFLAQQSASSLLEFRCDALEENTLERLLWGQDGALSDQENPRWIYLSHAEMMATSLQKKLVAYFDKYALCRGARVVLGTTGSIETLMSQAKVLPSLFEHPLLEKLHLSSLNERREDIELLAHYFLEKACTASQKSPKEFSSDVVETLKTHRYVSHIRELENAMRWVAISVPSSTILLEHLPIEWQKKEEETDELSWEITLKRQVRRQLEEGEKINLSDYLNKLEKLLIDEALKVSDGKKGQAAERLSLGRNTLTRKLQAYEKTSC